MIDQLYIDKLRAKIEGVEAELSSGAAGGPKLRTLMAEHSRLKRLHDLGTHYLALCQRRDEAQAILRDEDADTDLRGMAEEELAEIEPVLPDAEKKVMVALLPPDPANERNVIMEIRAGTGGDEAALFAADLFRMYARYSENRGWRIAVLDASPSNVGGYKEVIFSVEGQLVYQTLRYESGVHRVQRVPVTEASGRIHTSAATVAVLPEADELDDEIEIRTEDLRIDTFRSSGAGGQHVNTTDSAIRITHLPTGLVAQSQEERSQHRNKEKAMRVLKAKLLDIARTEEMNKAADARRSQIGTGDRSERIRTYNFPQNRVTDHRINLTLYNLESIIEGHIEELIEALYDADVTTRLSAQMSKE